MVKSKLKQLVGTVVVEERNKRGLSQTELANKAGVTQAIVSEIENGERNYRIETVERVLKALGKQVIIK
jgi:transcriptional regulator with XRE-family HTH domain